MTVLRVPAGLLAWVLAELVRDVLGALGAILYAIGRATFRLLWIPTVVLIVYAIVVRATVRVAMPPVVWLVLTGVWLAAVVLWVIGGVFRYVVLPRPVAYIRAGPRTGPVSAERIEEWESAWRRALRYQQTTSRRADCRDQPVSNTRRHEAGSAAAGSPYEILGVGRDVTQEQLRAAYRELAMRVHPDRNPGFVAEATERFAAIPPTSCCLTRDAEPRAISGSADADAVDRLDRSRYWLTEPFVGDSADRSTCGR